MGVGKILGPLALALIVGSSNLVSPQATEDAVLPAFLFLSVNMLLVALGFAFLGVETHGRPMALGDGGAGVSHGRSPRRSLGQVRALISTVNEAYPPKIQRGRG
jgi:MFS transporter, putative metabolite:H+ symporter